jgi:hypothetical protein
MRDCGILVHQQIIWVKNKPILTHSFYMWQHEPCFFGWKQGNKPSPPKIPISLPSQNRNDFACPKVCARRLKKNCFRALEREIRLRSQYYVRLTVSA